jgi:hypothetical protein
MNLPPIPPHMQELPLDKRGYPVPYFVQWVNGVPDFRVSNMRRIYECTNKKLCMICGKALNKDEGCVFAVGPLSTLTQTNDEPPMHRACAEFSAQVCPWMLHPGMKRIPKPLPDGTMSAGQLEAVGAINGGAPKVWALYDTDSYIAEAQENRTILYFMGEPREIHWWKAGRRATREEVLEALTDTVAFMKAYPGCESPEVQKHYDDRFTELGLWVPEAFDVHATQQT